MLRRTPSDRPGFSLIEILVTGAIVAVLAALTLSAVRTLVARNTVAFTSYLGVSGRDCAAADGALYQDSQVRLTSVADGTSNTLLLGARPPAADLQYGWWYAGTGQLLTGSGDMILGAREANILPARPGAPCRSGVYASQRASGFDDPCGMFHYWSPHNGGANFAFCDGSVRFLAYSADPVLPALATRAGGEVVEIP